MTQTAREKLTANVPRHLAHHVMKNRKEGHWVWRQDAHCAGPTTDENRANAFVLLRMALPDAIIIDVRCDVSWADDWYKRCDIFFDMPEDD